MTKMTLTPFFSAAMQAIRYVVRQRAHVIRTTLAVAVFGLLPACAATTPSDRPDDAYVKEAWAYFKKKCDTEAGEKIYKTFTGVKSVLVVKPLPPATEKDLYDQFWYGDPYSYDIPAADRGERVARKLIGHVKFIKNAHAQDGFSFIEQRTGEDENQKYQRIYPLAEPPFFRKSEITKPESRFGVAWEDISTPNDRKYWVAGSRLRILDLTDNSVIAERIGYFIEAGFGSTAGQRRPWMTSRGPSTTCPSIINRDFTDRWFVLKVINPAEAGQNGK
ncbi:MAG: hypothetical protein WD823_10770 [Sulfuricaulis sp.]|uniref:hypothetical protein n=1 Tax=Sulfuricaulis sp. TaxID=2003553 RepID=UPI0034A145D3